MPTITITLDGVVTIIDGVYTINNGIGNMIRLTMLWNTLIHLLGLRSR